MNYRNTIRYTENVKAWKKNFPIFVERFDQIKDTQSQLIEVSDGEYDLLVRGSALFGTSAKNWAYSRVQEFGTKDSSFRITVEPRSFGGVEDKIISRINDALNASEMTDFRQKPIKPECYHLVICGVALGEHLPLMAAITNCKHLILIESEPEYLYQSLYTFDWVELFKKFDEENRTITLIIDRCIETIMEEVIGSVRRKGPHRVDAMTLFLSYPDLTHEAAINLIIQNANKLVVGTGFFEDECDMIRNAYLNLKSHRGYYYSQQRTSIAYPAFIIGSGPSLDGSFDAIRENQENAIIVSCGTTIRLLLREGIVPDFHMEMENTPEISQLNETVAQSYDTSSITLVAANTIDPRVSKHFGQTIYYFRGNLASAPIFSPGDHTNIPFGVPTVANLGLSFAQEFGCREFYLFGVDLGTRDLERHHAKGSAYDSEEVPFEDILDISSRSNFGGKSIWSDNVFLWARDMLQEAANYNDLGYRYFNCSDGIYISGMTPRLPKTVSLPNRRNKAEALKVKIQKFPKYNHEKFEKAWNSRELIEKIRGLQETLLEQTNKYSKLDPLDFMNDLHQTLYPEDKIRAEHHLFRGTLTICMSALAYYFSRIKNTDVQKDVVNIGKKELGSVINHIAEKSILLINNIESEFE